MIVDIYTHIMPPQFLKSMERLGASSGLVERMASIRELHDLEARFRAMDAFGDYLEQREDAVAGLQALLWTLAVGLLVLSCAARSHENVAERSRPAADSSWRRSRLRARATSARPSESGSMRSTRSTAAPRGPARRRCPTA